MKLLKIDQNLIGNLVQTGHKVRGPGQESKLQTYYIQGQCMGKFPCIVKCKGKISPEIIYRTYLQQKSSHYFMSVGGTQCRSRDLLEIRLYPVPEPEPNEGDGGEFHGTLKIKLFTGAYPGSPNGTGWSKNINGEKQKALIYVEEKN